MYENVIVEIVEQPAPKSLRFRYPCECERGSAGSIVGVNSTVDNRTFPAIRVLNYTGDAIVLVSCVSKDEPYRPHPHSLFGKNGCCKGVCKKEFSTHESAPTVILFQNMGIQCCKKGDIEKLLTEREELRIDPFKTGFKHKNKLYSDKDLSTIRLCFQVLLKPKKSGDVPNAKYELIKPVVSNPIVDRKFVTDFEIYDISDTSSPSSGGKKIMIFCEKIVKTDIKIRFFKESENNSVEWEDYGKFQLSNVHRQIAIAFKTPPYAATDIDKPVNVSMQLIRPSDGHRSKPLDFQYVPNITNVNNLLANKKRKIEESKEFCEFLQAFREQKRQRSLMELNINPTTGANHVAAVNTELPVTSHQPILNSHRDVQVQNNSVQSYHLQQQQICNLDTQQLPRNSNLEESSCYPHRQQQHNSNFLQQPQNSHNLQNPSGYLRQHSNIHLQQHLAAHQQHPNNSHLQQHRNNSHLQQHPNNSHLHQHPNSPLQSHRTSHLHQDPNGHLEPHRNSHLQHVGGQRQHLRSHLQQHPGYFQQNSVPSSSQLPKTFSNVGYGLNLSSNYIPVPHYSNVGQQFCLNDVTVGNHLQSNFECNVENNFKIENIEDIENVSNESNLLLL